MKIPLGDVDRYETSNVRPLRKMRGVNIENDYPDRKRNKRPPRNKPKLLARWPDGSYT